MASRNRAFLLSQLRLSAAVVGFSVVASLALTFLTGAGDMPGDGPVGSLGAEARRFVARGQRTADSTGYGLQQQVADLVPERVVDRLEAIHVNEQDGR